MRTSGPGLVFGRGSLRIPTGAHVEVFREAIVASRGPCYGKRFLNGPFGDLRSWTERERRILEQLGRVEGAPVARLLPIAAAEGASLHTFDAGPTVDQWASRVVLRRNGQALDCLFEDRACWWGLAHHCLVALDRLHPLDFVHLELKADNICIPWTQPGQGQLPTPGGPITLRFEALTFIDVAFALLPGVPLPGALPLDRQPHYEYQSARLLEALAEGRRGDLTATRALDWRCDLFSLAAMLWRYLPEPEAAATGGWTEHRHAQAQAFVRLLVDADTSPLPAQRPHAELIRITGLRLAEPELGSALQAGLTFDAECGAARRPTPPTVFFGQASEAVPPHAPPPASSASLQPGAPPPAIEQAVAARSVDLLLPDWPPGPVMSVDLLLPDLAAVRPPAAASAGQPPPDASPVQAPSVGVSVQAPPLRESTTSTPPIEASLHAPLPAQTPATAAPTLDPLPPERRPDRIEPTLQCPEPATPIAGTPAPDPLLRPAPTPPVAPPGRPARRVLIPALAALALAAVAGLAWRLHGDGGPVASLPRPTLADPTTRQLAPPPKPAPAPAALPAAAAPTLPAPSAAVSTALPPASVGSADAAIAEPKPLQPRQLPVEIFIPSAPGPASSAPQAQAEAPPAADFDDVARRLMQGPIQRVAGQAASQLAPVLAAAALPTDRRSASNVRAAAQAARRGASKPALTATVATRQARRLNEAARIAYWQRDNVAEAVKLQSRAFGADPLDTEVVGNLAFLRLRENPPQADAARTLALHALALNDSRFPAGRVEDWTTLAIASAMTGREVDARNAWYVTLAVSNDVQRHCKAAVRAQAIYGDALRSSVQAMLQRARSWPGYANCGSSAARPTATSARSRPAASPHGSTRRH